MTDDEFLSALNIVITNLDGTADTRACLEIARKLFHRLWGRDKEHSDYDKHEWSILQLMLNRLEVKV